MLFVVSRSTELSFVRMTVYLSSFSSVVWSAGCCKARRASRLRGRGEVCGGQSTRVQRLTGALERLTLANGKAGVDCACFIEREMDAASDGGNGDAVGLDGFWRAESCAPIGPGLMGAS